MLIDIEEEGGFIIFTIQGKRVEFTESDLASIGIDSDTASGMLKSDGSLLSNGYSN